MVWLKILFRIYTWMCIWPRWHLEMKRWITSWPSTWSWAKGSRQVTSKHDGMLQTCSALHLHSADLLRENLNTKYSSLTAMLNQMHLVRQINEITAFSKVFFFLLSLLQKHCPKIWPFEPNLEMIFMIICSLIIQIILIEKTLLHHPNEIFFT